jgi:predicted phosphodiesterase
LTLFNSVYVINSVDKAHELISSVKQLALELGRTPRRDEILSQIKGARWTIETVFRNYTALIQAAGLDAAQVRKIDNSIFERDIESHLKEYQPRPYQPPGPYPRAAIISDIHWPFESQRVVEAFYRYVEKHKAEWVILNGDAFDFYSHSKYPRSHNLFTPREEEQLARTKSETFWQEIQRLSPKSKCVFLLGNHDIRPMKRVLESYPEAEDWIKERMTKLFTYPGVKTMMDPREEIYLDERTIVFHGYRSKLGDHRDFTHFNCFNGHTHVGGVVWKQLRHEVIFECNSGVAGDPMAKGLTYTPQKVTNWTPGFAVCDEYGPRFVPA